MEKNGPAVNFLPNITRRHWEEKPGLKILYFLPDRGFWRQRRGKRETPVFWEEEASLRQTNVFQVKVRGREMGERKAGEEIITTI